MITIVGLGPGAVGHLSLETMGYLKKEAQVILRTAVHPTVAELERQGVKFSSCDDLYEKSESFEEVYGAVVDRVIAAAAQGEVVYAVPGSPLVAEKTVVLLREKAKELGIDLCIKPSMSFLDLAYVNLGIDPIAGLRIIDAQDFEAIGDAGRYPLMITQVYSQMVASDLKLSLMENLPDDYEIYFLRNLGLEDEECRPIPLFELDRQPQIDHLTSAYIPPMAEDEEEGLLYFGEEEEADEEGFEEIQLVEGEETTLGYVQNLDDFDIMPLVEVMKTLREPGGCPWDREQTHSSIRSNFVEEVYEFLEAVDDKDVAGMREELGDVLMQVVFHARISQEAGEFDLQEVIDEVVDKLIRRHPHVYGETHVDNSAQVLVNWEAIKKEEKTERKSVLDGVAKGLPSLLKAHKLQSKAAKVGFDWEDKAAVWSKVEEELGELKEALAEESKEKAEAELGDLLFALVNYARHCGLEPEVALEGTNNRFTKRFRHVEQCVLASGKDWKEYTLAELDCFWDDAKAQEKTKNN